MVLEYNALEAGLSIAPLSLSMFAVALVAGKKAGKRSPSKIIRAGFLLLLVGVAVLIPFVPRVHSGWALFLPLMVAGSGLGLLVSQLNNYTLAPIEEERVSEAAGVNSAGGSFGLSFGLAFAGAIMLASLSLIFTNMANSSDVLSARQADRVSSALEKNAEVMTNTHPKASPATARGEGGDPPHQHQGAADSPPDRAARPAHRRAARASAGLPDDPAPRPRAVGSRREPASRLSGGRSATTAILRTRREASHSAHRRWAARRSSSARCPIREAIAGASAAYASVRDWATARCDRLQSSCRRTAKPARASSACISASGVSQTVSAPGMRARQLGQGQALTGVNANRPPGERHEDCSTSVSLSRKASIASQSSSTNVPGGAVVPARPRTGKERPPARSRATTTALALASTPT
jgi:hypothetical protein